MKFMLVFLGVLLADVAWTLYFIETGKGRAVAAGLWSAAIVGIGAFTTVQYVHDPKLVAAAVAGAFVGTWATVLYKKRAPRQEGA
jgi:hypothetical protein